MTIERRKPVPALPLTGHRVHAAAELAGCAPGRIVAENPSDLGDIEATLSGLGGSAGLFALDNT